MLQLKNICKSYKTGNFVQKALDDVSVSFRDSEFVAVLGPSGSGKTTLLNVIGGLMKYDSGDLLINGVSTKQYKDRDWDAYRNHEVGFVFQGYNLIPHQTVLSNVELALTLSGISARERRRRATEALQKVGLGDHIKKHPNQLSGGQQQRVAIARALVNNPSIIFADEPTGALDTKTSVAIMDLLREVSKDRLVVMVTHNPDLANEYATRVVNLQDGRITADSKPFTPNTAAAKLNQKQRTAMSFLTALSLSFANLMGKKGRTFMTAFAGSIGIIGISAILALSTGTSQYIDNVENNTLSQYPLMISRTKSLLSGDSADATAMSDKIKAMRYNNQEDNKIGVRSVLSTLLSSSGGNDLQSLKAYLETNPENFESYTTSVEYKYNTTPVIYTTKGGETRRVYPSSSGTSSSTSTSSSATGISATSSGTTMSSYTSGFSVLPKEESLYKDKYSVAAGRWPERADECVLVLHQDGTITDSLLYTLGLRDYNELKTAYQNYYQNEKVNLPEDYDDITFDQVLGLSFKVVNPADCYAYNSSTGIWESKSGDTDYMNTLVQNGTDLKIVGVINAPEGNSTAMALSAGINYAPELAEKSIDAATNTEIVKQQLARPDFDVLAGKTFAEEKADGGSVDTNVFSNLIQFDSSALTNLFSIDTSKLYTGMPQIEISQDQIQQIIASAMNEENVAKIFADIAGNEQLDKDTQEIMVKAVQAYNVYAAEHPGASAKDYFSSTGEGYKYIEDELRAAGKDCTPEIVKHLAEIVANTNIQTASVITSAVTNAVSQLSGSLSNLGSAFSFNSSALSNAIKVDFSKEKLMALSSMISGASTRTYESNLADFGYADRSNPLSITIYPKDFWSKDQISAIIDNYNSAHENDGKEISYTDYAKLMMKSLTTMIDMITAVLIAFVAISLVVSSIMIGIITYISVLERRREIGILRAIGARKLDIFNVFNAETFIVGLVAGVIGIAFTAVMCFPANVIARVAFNTEYDIANLPVLAAIVLIFISVFLTFVAGLIPSTSASKKDPVEAINS